MKRINGVAESDFLTNPNGTLQTDASGAPILRPGVSEEIQKEIAGIHMQALPNEQLLAIAQGQGNPAEAQAATSILMQRGVNLDNILPDNGNTFASNIRLSNETDENGIAFVLAPSGTTAFGYIGKETGLPEAPIKLSQGQITDANTNAGYGLVHIEARHGEQIRNAGYASVVDFIQDVVSNYSDIREGNTRDGNRTYLMQLVDKHNNTLYIELSQDGSYWNINSAGIFNKKYASGNKVVYSRHTQTNQPAVVGGGSPSAGLSGTQTNASTMPPTTNGTVGKGTTSYANNQTNPQENFPMRTVGRGKNQKQTEDWLAATPEQALAHIASLLPESETDGFIADNLDAAQSALAKLQKANPTKGITDLAERQAAMQAHNQAVQQAKDMVSFWKNTQALRQQQQQQKDRELMQKAQAHQSASPQAQLRQIQIRINQIEEQRARRQAALDKARKSSREAYWRTAQQIYGALLDTDPEPQTIYEYIADGIRRYPPSWQDVTINGTTHRGLRSHMLGNNNASAKDEGLQSLCRTQKKGGLPLEETAHKIWESLPDELKEQYDAQTVLNEVIDMFLGNDAATISDYIHLNRVRMAEEEKQRAEDEEIEYLSQQDTEASATAAIAEVASERPQNHLGNSYAEEDYRRQQEENDAAEAFIQGQQEQPDPNLFYDPEAEQPRQTETNVPAEAAPTSETAPVNEQPTAEEAQPEVTQPVAANEPTPVVEPTAEQTQPAAEESQPAVAATPSAEQAQPAAETEAPITIPPATAEYNPARYQALEAAVERKRKEIEAAVGMTEADRQALRKKFDGLKAAAQGMPKDAPGTNEMAKALANTQQQLMNWDSRRDALIQKQLEQTDEYKQMVEERDKFLAIPGITGTTREDCLKAYQYGLQGKFAHLANYPQIIKDFYHQGRIDREAGRDRSDLIRQGKYRGAEQEQTSEPKPIGKGVFGNIYDQFKGKVKEAVAFLKEKREGCLKGVFHRNEIGDVDLVWGDRTKNEGLDHIIKDHIEDADDFKSVEEAVAVIDDVIKNGTIIRNNQYKATIEKDGYRVVVQKNYRDNEGNIVSKENWVVTAFDISRPKSEKKRESSQETLTTPPSDLQQQADGVTLPSNDSSTSKGNTTSPNNQTNPQQNQQPTTKKQNSGNIQDFGEKQEKTDENGNAVLFMKSDNTPSALTDSQNQALLEATVGPLMAKWKQNGRSVVSWMTQEEADQAAATANTTAGVRFLNRNKDKKIIDGHRAIQGETSNTGTVVSVNDAAKVRKNLESLAQEYEKGTNNTRGLLTNIAIEMGVQKEHASEYTTFELPNGGRITLRMSNHNAKATNFDERGEDNVVSIVISSFRNKGLKGVGNADVVEFYYNKKKLEGMDGKPLADIIRDIANTIETGEYDCTVHPQEVNSTYTDVNGERRTRVESYRDYAYRKAVEKGDMATAQQMLQEEAARKGYSPESGYMGDWFNGSAPTNFGQTIEERQAAWENDEWDNNMALGDFVRGIDTNDLEWQLFDPRSLRGADAAKRESIMALRDAVERARRGEKGVKVKMYRAVPATVKEGKFRNGDWITPSRAYAENHASIQEWSGDYRIIEEECSIEDIWWDGNDINEWGFDDGQEYAYKNTENNRKLLDVTRDADGEIIPLSERFNDRTDDIRFYIGNKKRADYEARLAKAGYTPEEIAKQLDFLHSLEQSKDNDKLIKVALAWLGKKGIQDVTDKLSDIQKAIKVAQLAKADPTQFASPQDVFDAFPQHTERANNAERINPDNVPTLTNRKDIGNGVVIYDVEDSPQGQQDMRQIINTHFGKDANPWCLLQGDGNGNLTKDAAYYWGVYSAYPKQVAFYNGKLTAFSANKSNTETWWDREDHPTDNVLDTATQTTRTTENGMTTEREVTLSGTLLKETIIFPDGSKKVSEWREEHPYPGEPGRTAIVKEYSPEGRLQRTLREEITYYENGQLKSHSLYDENWRGISSEMYNEDGSLYATVVEESDNTRLRTLYNPDGTVRYTNRYFRTEAGEILGYADIAKQEIKLDPNAARPETFIHEYTHPWCTLLRMKDPKLWSKLKDAVRRELKDSPIWKHVEQAYPELRANEDQFIEEVFAFATGKQGQRMLEDAMKEALRTPGITEKAAAVAAVERIRQTLKNIWNTILRFLGFGNRVASVKDFSNLTLHDLYVNQRDVMSEVSEMQQGEQPQSGLRFNLGDSNASFRTRQQRAEVSKGAVAPGLNEQSVTIQKIEPHTYKGSGRQAREQAMADAKKKYVPNGTPRVLHYDNFGQQFDYTISGNSIDEAGNRNAVEKSDNLGVHISLLNHLDKVIENSIEVEEHPDYLKGNDGKRGPENGINPDRLVHRFYGAVEIDGKTYRVKTTMLETLTRGNHAYTYEVTKIEVLNDETPSTPNGMGGSKNTILPLAKLLQGVEKSYDSGVKILDVSQKNTETPVSGAPKVPTSEQVHAEADRFAEQYGMPIRVIDNTNEITHPNPERQERMRRSKGWFDPQTGELVIVAPNAESVADIQETVQHEVVAHKGLSKLLGDNYGTFLDYVFNNADRKAKQKIMERMHAEGWTGEQGRRRATDEFLGDTAEEADFSQIKEKAWWQKAIDFLKDLLRKAGITIRLTENEIRYHLWRSHQNLINEVKGRKQDTPFQKAQDITLRHNLGVGERITQPTIEEANKRFNEQLQDLIRGKAGSRRMSLGYAGSILQSAGIADAEVILEYDKLLRKGKGTYKNQHPFNAEDMKDLPLRINNPIAVFDSATHRGDKVILTTLQKDGKNFIVVLRAQQVNRKGGVVLEVNEIMTLYPKDMKGVVKWINDGLGQYFNKEEALHWLGQSRSHPGPPASAELQTAAKVVENFDNPKLSSENLSAQPSDVLLRDGKAPTAETDAEIIKTPMQNDALRFPKRCPSFSKTTVFVSGNCESCRSRGNLSDSQQKGFPLYLPSALGCSALKCHKPWKRHNPCA